jgi:ABC-2 type transport system ATP-binding protein
MSETAIAVEGLRKHFVLPLTRKHVQVLESLSFSVERGSIVGFLGANGAGKTTTLKIILGLIFQDAGQVKLFNQDHRKIELKERIGFLTERPYFYDYLTVREFLEFTSQLFSEKKKLRAIDDLLADVGLQHAADRPMRRFSKGMLQRAGIAQALLNNPDLLILDEPMSGLDPDGRAEMAEIIRRAHQRGATILFSSHTLPDVESLCDRVIMIDKGHLVFESSIEDLLDKETKGFELRLQGDAHAKAVGSLDELQRAIDEARREKRAVEHVRALRPTLEEIFLKYKRSQK